jgi:FtsH-binding integral membrane protein
MRKPLLFCWGKEGFTMADYDNSALRAQTGVATDAIDQGLRSYMLRVYNYMFIGLLLTGAAAWGTFSAAAIDTGHGLTLTDFGQTLYFSGFRIAVMLAPLAFVLVLSFGIKKMSAGMAQILFWLFAGVMGVSISWIFIAYQLGSVAQVFFITAAAFGGLSLYGYTTKRDLNAMGAFLVMGLWGLIIASLVNLFLRSEMTMWVISVAGVGIFAGLTAYDTQKIKEMYYTGDDGAVAVKKSIMGALALYLDFLNMFLFLLRLLGNRR